MWWWACFRRCQARCQSFWAVSPRGNISDRWAKSGLLAGGCFSNLSCVMISVRSYNLNGSIHSFWAKVNFSLIYCYILYTLIYRFPIYFCIDNEINEQFLVTKLCERYGFVDLGSVCTVFCTCLSQLLCNWLWTNCCIILNICGEITNIKR